MTGKNNASRGGERNIIDHNYPVIVGSKCDFSKENARIGGTYITIRDGKVKFYLTSGQVTSDCVKVMHIRLCKIGIRKCLKTLCFFA